VAEKFNSITAPGDRAPTDLDLERFRLGEGSEKERAFLKEWLDRDEALQARLAELEEDAQRFAETRNLGAIAASTLDRAARPATNAWTTRLFRRPTRQQAASFAVLAGSVAVGLFFLLPLVSRTLESPDVRLKGSSAPRLSVQVLRGAQQWTYQEGLEVAPGDRLRFGWPGGQSGFAYLFGADGTGTVVQYAPRAGETATYAEPHKDRHWLPGAVRLDDAPGPERYVVFLCPNALDPEQLTPEPSDSDPAHPLANLQASLTTLGCRAFVQSLNKTAARPNPK
jgi:hypothetical protein